MSHRAVLQRHARTFALAGRLLPPAQLDDAARLYAFCRHIDDLADDPRDRHHSAQRLLTLRQLDADDPDPQLADFLDLARRRDIDLDAARDLIDGCLGDLLDTPVRIADDDALLTYAYRVAGTVGLMICGLLEVEDPAAAPHAVDLGIAMQLTNICRDVLEDAREDRVYLPATRLHAAGCHPDELVAALRDRADLATTTRVHRAIERVVAGLLVLAEQRYQSAERGFRFIPARARLGIVAAAWMYRAIGRQLRRRHHRAWQGRTVVGPARKSLELARALATVARGSLAR